jgi:hypothetical protein
MNLHYESPEVVDNVTLSGVEGSEGPDAIIPVMAFILAVAVTVAGLSFVYDVAVGWNVVVSD